MAEQVSSWPPVPGSSNPIFADDLARRCFLVTVGEACQKTGWQVHAYCLTSNHFHLVLETPQPNLSASMKWLLGTYTSRFNRRHEEFGHLFRGRFKALIVDGSGTGYLKTVCNYVHLNPIRAKLVKSGRALESFSWSRYGQYLQPRKQRWPWLRVDRLLGEWGIPKDSAVGRDQFAQRMEVWRRQETKKGEWKTIKDDNTAGATISGCTGVPNNANGRNVLIHQCHKHQRLHSHVPRRGGVSIR